MNKIAINNGLFLGATLVIASALFYFVNIEWYLLFKSYILLVVVVLLYFKTANDIKKSQDGMMTFGEGFLGIIIASAVGFAICTIFEYITYNIIDPTLADQLKDMSLAKIEEASAFMNDDMMDDMMEKLEEQSFNLDLGKSLLNYGIRMLFPAAALGAIVAAITKKSEPDFLA